jgi:hypothetical protein
MLENSGVIKSWIQTVYNIAESTGEVPINDRLVSLIILSEMWRLRPDVVESTILNAS